jgi:hypothetical protein
VLVFVVTPEVEVVVVCSTCVDVEGTRMVPELVDVAVTRTAVVVV